MIWGERDYTDGAKIKFVLIFLYVMKISFFYGIITGMNGRCGLAFAYRFFFKRIVL